jgi:hypothetical protein
LKGLAAGYQAHASCPFIDGRRSDSLREIVFSGRSAGIDQTRTAHEAIHHLVARHVDRVLRGKLRIDLLVFVIVPTKLTKVSPIEYLAAMG